MSSRGNNSTPSISGRGYDDSVDLSSDSWGESRTKSREVTLAFNAVEPVSVSRYEGTSSVLVDPHLFIPLVDLLGTAAGPFPMGPSRPLGLLLINPASVFKEEDLSCIRYSYGTPNGVDLMIPSKEDRPD
ncbi:hypothetical protein ACOSQ2_027138 [Xanthoceras sorbifolium]